MNMYSNMFTPIPVLSDHFNIKCFNYGFYDLQVLYVAENKLLGFYIMPSHEILSIQYKQSNHVDVSMHSIRDYFDRNYISRGCLHKHHQQLQQQIHASNTRSPSGCSNVDLSEFISKINDAKPFGRQYNFQQYLLLICGR